LQLSTLAKRAWPLLLLIIIVSYFYGLGRLPFVGPDEPRYAEVAREMFQRHDLVTPTLNGQPWFEKPVLLYWMMIASFAVFGISEWAARLGPIVSGLLTIAAIYWIGRCVDLKQAVQERKLGLTSGLMAASSAGLIVFSRGASFDIIVTMTITVALGFFLTVEIESDAKRRNWFLAGFYCFVGVSLLAKGLVGIVIPFGVLTGYYIFRRQWPQKAIAISSLWGIPLALAIAAVWYGPVIVRHGRPFIDQFFIQHHFARYVSNKYHHPEPVYFYLVVIVLLSLPWTPFLVEALFKARRWRWRSSEPEDKFRVFALAWLLVPILFFSFSGSKLPGYILPSLAAAILLSADRVTTWIHDRSAGRWTMRATGGALLVIAIVAIAYAVRTNDVSPRCALLVGAPLILGALLVMVWTGARLGTIVLILCAALFATDVAAGCAVDQFAKRESIRDLIQLADARGYGTAPIFTLHKIDRTAEFYAAGRLVYGSDGEPVRFDGPAPVAVAARVRQAPILVIVPVKYVWQLSDLPGTETTEIGNNGSMALVAVRPK
jgi:4-amino-4-deoxy-L-arabinose transferase-like glycosyltransferase